MEFTGLLETSILNGDTISLALIILLIMFNQYISKKSFHNDDEILNNIKSLETNFNKKIDKINTRNGILFEKIEIVEKDVLKLNNEVDNLKQIIRSDENE